MSVLHQLDQIFDLDMALTTSATTAENSGQTPELSASIPSSRKNYQIELPAVTAVGLCTVCMEGFEPSGKGNQLPCGHIFHGSCIHKWLSLHNFCPLCRFNIAADVVQDVAVNT